MANIKPMTLILIISLLFFSAICEITVKPSDTKAVVGNMTRICCSSNSSATISWSFYPKGKSVPTFICYNEKVVKAYEGKALLEKENSTGARDLVILSVNKNDSGRYVCEEHGGEGSEAQLVVLDSPPVCESKLNGAEVIGPNSCGVPVDNVSLSCSVTYHGNIQPKIEWRRNGTLVTNGVQTTSNGSSVTSFLSLDGNVAESGFYICQTTQSASCAISQYKCSPIWIKIIHVIDNTSLSGKTGNESATCLIEENRLCTYKWTFFNGTDVKIVSENYTIQPQSMGKGLYRCEAECILKNSTCQITSGHFATWDIICPKEVGREQESCKVCWGLYSVPCGCVMVVTTVLAVPRIQKHVRDKDKGSRKSVSTQNGEEEMSNRNDGMSRDDDTQP